MQYRDKFASKSHHNYLNASNFLQLPGENINSE